MKLYRHFLLLGTAIGLMMPGCTQDEEKLIDTGDELTIQASAREITLKEADAGKEALKLTDSCNFSLENIVVIDYMLYVTINLMLLSLYS